MDWETFSKVVVGCVFALICVVAFLRGAKPEFEDQWIDRPTAGGIFVIGADVIVEVERRDGSFAVGSAKSFDWHITGHPQDILRFRIAHRFSDAVLSAVADPKREGEE